MLTAIPVSVVMIGMRVTTYKAFQEEHQAQTGMLNSEPTTR